MATNALDFDFTQAGGPGAELRQGPTREEVAAQEAGRKKTLGMIEGIFAAPFQAATPTSLPELGALAGTLLPVVAAESRLAAPIMAVTRAAPAVVRPFVPTLVGSTAGTVAGTLGEQAFTGQDILSSLTAQKVLGNVIENAMYDIGGNLIFSVGGKAIKVTKDKLAELSTKPGMFDTAEGSARKQAQEWFVRNSDLATLTKGQLTGDTTLQQIESALSVAPGSAKVFETGAQRRVGALNKGIADVMSSLETSDAFKQALKVDVPSATRTTQSAVGTRFQTAVTTAMDEMKKKYRPTYQRMEAEGDGLLVDVKPYKAEAQFEIDKINKRYPKGNYPDSEKQKLDVLRQITGLDDTIPFSAAHEIRSDFLESARGLQQEGKATSSAEVWYNKAASGLRNRMDDVAIITFGNEEEKALARKLGLQGGVDQPAGLRAGQYLSNADSIEKMNLGTTIANKTNNPLLRDYFNAQQGYKDAMMALQDATIRGALKEEPKAVGKFLFNPETPDRVEKVRNAVREAQKYLPKEQSKGLLGELQYGYLDEMFGSPKGLETFNKKMQDKTFREGFNVVFGDNKQLQEIANAAKYGLQEQSGGGTFLRTAAGTATGQAITGATLLGLTYLASPSEVTDKFDPLQMVATGTGIILTPYLISKSLNNRQAVTALATLAKAQKDTKYSGALFAKGMDMLNKSGVIDNEYLNSLQTTIYGSGQQVPQEAAPPKNALEFNFSE